MLRCTRRTRWAVLQLCALGHVWTGDWGDSHLPAERPPSNTPAAKPPAPDEMTAPSSLTQAATSHNTQAQLPNHQCNQQWPEAERKGPVLPGRSTSQKQSPEHAAGGGGCQHPTRAASFNMQRQVKTCDQAPQQHARCP